MSAIFFIKKIRKYFNYSLSIVLFIFIPMFFTIVSCSNKNEDSGKFFEGNYTDDIIFQSKSDSLNIVIEQINLAPNLKNYIAYSYITSNLKDTTKLKLFVSYGNFEPVKPKVYSQVNQLNDTIYIWYANRHPISKRLFKNNSITKAEPTPPPAYVRIDSLHVYSASKANIISRIIK